MSSKSTILSIPCCHIFHDYCGAGGKESLAVSVDYGNIVDGRDDNDYIEVDKDSEFANLMRYLMRDKTEEELLKASKGEL